MSADTYAALAFMALCAVVSVLAVASLRRSRRRAWLADLERDDLAVSLGLLPAASDYLAPWRDRTPGRLPQRNGRVS